MISPAHLISAEVYVGGISTDYIINDFGDLGIRTWIK